jgi:hypothetical protein
MQDISLFLLENFPSDMKALGESKFKTPRCNDEKIPIIVLPEGVTNGISTFKDKQYLHIDFQSSEKNKFSKITSWIQSLSDKPLYPLINDLDDGAFQMKIKLPAEFSVINTDGSETNYFHSSNGSTIECAIELPCVWETNTNIGISFQMIQCKIIKNQQCLIQAMDEDPNYVPFKPMVQSSESSV